jgi:hypothetical protein
MAIKILPYIFCLFPLLATCQTSSENSAFDKYWLQGKAELTGYKLEQARYGELHKGEAVLIFGAEDFSRSKQVKLDNPSRNPTDAIKVLKSHLTKKFATGIYDYSLTQSVFTPINRAKYPHSIKSTASLQDWNGHSFMQINLQTYKYRIQQFSYFENEADNEMILDKAYLEDELFNLIRINPAELPLGSISILPGSLVSRLLHQSMSILEAEATLSAHATQPTWQTYALEYKDSNRSLKIHFQNEFPHTIEGWEETYPEAGKILTTTATRQKTILSDYWNKHNTTDIVLRKELGF